MAASSLKEVRRRNQSLWLDNIHRGLLTSGTLARYIDQCGVRGLTSNPTIYEHALARGHDYDDVLKSLMPHYGQNLEELFFALALEDLRSAADLFAPIHEASEGQDGFVSLELSPKLADDADASVAQAQRLHNLAQRPNLLIKVPGTPAGERAIEELIALGVGVNVTLLFSPSQYLRAAEAYFRGLERRLARRLDLRVASVASVFVSRWDTAMNASLASSERNRLGLAVAYHCYDTHRRLYATDRWKRLAAHGAHPQRLLWASTSSKDPTLPPAYYVEQLVYPNTIDTVPEPTLLAFLNEGQPRPTMTDDDARLVPDLLSRGKNLKRTAEELQKNGCDAFVRSFVSLLERLKAECQRLRQHTHSNEEPRHDSALTEALEQAARNDVVARIWKHDWTLWGQQPDEISNRLGWLHIVPSMRSKITELENFATECRDEGIRHVLWCGMGGSSLFASFTQSLDAPTSGSPRLDILDTSHPDFLRRRLEAYRPEETLVVVASKSGSTLETRTQLDLFWSRDPNGRRYVAVTDPGTPLDELATSRRFRNVFRNDPTLGGRYSALSHFGLLAWALRGLPLEPLLHGAESMMHACLPSVSPQSNPGLKLGLLLGHHARSGRDKATILLPPPLRAFGGWLEQLLAESTGKHGRGIIPIVGEDLAPPDRYGDDRFFVALGGANDSRETLRNAGHPVYHDPDLDRAPIGGQVFAWEFATAVAGHVLGINAFDQPNVEAAKKAAARILEHRAPDIPIESPKTFLERVRPHDYIGLQLYLDPESPILPDLMRLRTVLRDRTGAATTLGLGPRFLHSTGQLHKGGPREGVFLQVLDQAMGTLPIPGRKYGFEHLIRAQADGDYEALVDHGMRVARVRLEDLLAF
jgi:transaldolase/glucose-6-phosphate isomerase